MDSATAHDEALLDNEGQLRRRCSECGKFLPPDARPQKKTCNDTCRGARKRRLDRLARQIGAGDGDGAKAVSKVLSATQEAPASSSAGKAREILAEVFADELRPVVREAITEETLRAIQGMVALTPIMVQKLGEDLDHPDPQIRHKAIAVMARYTLGHQAIVTPPEQTAPQMTVVFDGMARPEVATVVGQEDTTPSTDAELRECNSCGVAKPDDEFVQTSDRCYACHDALKARAERILDPGEDNGMA